MTDKTIITCALTGSAPTTDKNPAVPVSPQQIAESALAVERAGGAIVHIHVRDPETGSPSMDPALYREVVARVRDAGSNLILNLTTGPGGRYIPGEGDPTDPATGTTLTTPETRVAHVEELKPEICSLDVATMNMGNAVFMNTPPHLAAMAKRIKAVGVKPELEVFDAGHARLASQMVADGLIDAPPLFQLCLGISWGAPMTPESMIFMKNLLPDGANWSAFGISSGQFPMAATATILGGNVRVGMEDNIYIARGKLTSGNDELVDRAVNIVQNVGGDVATPDEARGILGLS